MNEPFGFGIIGTGNISIWHAEGINAHPDCEIVAAYNRTLSKAETFAEKYNCDVEKDWRELIERDDIHAVCICSASGLHSEQSIAASHAGKHVLVEKPMAIHLEDAAEMIIAARENDTKLGVIFQKRTVNDVNRLKKAVSDGVFGKILFGDASIKWWRNQAYYDSGAWRGTWDYDGGGCTMNQGIHGIDILQYIMGVEVEKVYAKIATAAHDIEVEDVAIALLTYKNGAFGRIQTSTAVNPGQGNIIEINGTLGTAILTDDTITGWAVSDSKETPAKDEIIAESAERSASASNPMDLSMSGHIAHVRNFVNAVRNGEELICSGEEGIKSLRIIIALYESARRGEEVSLDELPGGNLEM
ncbi:Gfo/Idh/MocA family protein [Candidatus Latescibacterota bacterium]